jgi:hypothetical protein
MTPARRACAGFSPAARAATLPAGRSRDSPALRARHRPSRVCAPAVLRRAPGFTGRAAPLAQSMTVSRGARVRIFSAGAPSSRRFATRRLHASDALFEISRAPTLTEKSRDARGLSPSVRTTVQKISPTQHASRKTTNVENPKGGRPEGPKERPSPAPVGGGGRFGTLWHPTVLNCALRAPPLRGNQHV